MRTLQRRRAKRGMYSTGVTTYPRTINQVDKIKSAEKTNVKKMSFEEEYEAFIALERAKAAAAEAKEQEAKAEEPVLAPGLSYVETEVTETTEPIKVEVVEEPVTEEAVVEPVKKTRKKKVEVAEEA